MTMQPPPLSNPVPGSAPAYRSYFANNQVSFAKLVRSEAIKLWTIRSTYWCFGLSLLGILGFALLTSFAMSSQINSASSGVSVSELVGTSDLSVVAAFFAASGVGLVQLILVVQGSLLIGGEYATGMIRSTMSADPKRWRALIAKATVLSWFAFVLSLVTLIISYFISSAVFSSVDLQTDLWHGESWRMIFGGALFLALISIFAVMLSAITRNSAGGIGLSMALLLVVPPLLSVIPGDIFKEISKFFPAAGVTIAYPQDLAEFSPWQDLLITVAWVAVLSVLAIFAIKKRDV